MIYNSRELELLLRCRSKTVLSEIQLRLTVIWFFNNKIYTHIYIPALESQKIKNINRAIYLYNTYL